MQINFLKILFLGTLFFINFLHAFELETITDTKVMSVVDGDTITVSKDNKVYTIRLLGIQAPEIFTTPIWPYGIEAKNCLNSLIYGKYVDIQYVKDNKMDKYQRILGIVYLNKQNINLTMIQKGYAFVYIVGKISKIPGIKQFIEEENKAIANNINIWSHDYYRIINPKEADKYVGQYKIIDAHVYSMSVSSTGYWLYLGEQKDNSLSLRISHASVAETGLNIESFNSKKLRIRGFIDRYSTKFSPFVNVRFKETIEIQ